MHLTNDGVTKKMTVRSEGLNMKQI